MIRIDNRPVGQHCLVIRFLRSVFAQRPALPKTGVTWDTEVVLHYLKSLSPVKYISLKSLTLKLTVLLLLLAGQRGQTVHLYDVRNMTLSYSHVTFRLGDPVKQTVPGRHLGEVAYTAYAPNRRLCVVTVLKEYLQRTLNRRGTCTRLLLTHTGVGRPASRGSIRRWTKEVLIRAGIDMSIFKPHSTRSASTSKVVSRLPLQTILKTAGWSRASTFRKYYEKRVDTKFDFCGTVQA